VPSVIGAIVNEPVNLTFFASRAKISFTDRARAYQT